MKGMYRVALMLGLVAASAVGVEAAEYQGSDEITTEIYVMNNHLADVRVFAEDADGRLHKLGRVARGDLRTFEVPEELADEEFRIKIYPSTPVWSPNQKHGSRMASPVVSRRRTAGWTWPQSV